MTKRVKVYLEGGIDNPKFVVSHLPCSIEFTSLQDCDVVLSAKPVWGSVDIMYHQKVFDSYRDSPKPVIAFWVTDYEGTVTIPPQVTLYRTSIRKSLRSDREELLPYVFEPITRPLLVLDATKRPIIGFCGLASWHRKPLLDYMRTRPELDCRFIERTLFWGGNPHDPQLVKEFEDNIVESHFTVCNRGAGAFSMRLYQVLSAGRIPVLIDTDMILPFCDDINWDEISVRASTPEELVDRLVKFYYSCDIKSVQRKCREIHQAYFDAERYFERVFSGFSCDVS